MAIDLQTASTIPQMFKDTDLAWWLQQGFSFASPIIAAVGALWIARSSYKHGLEVQAKDYQNKFQLEAYNRISKSIEEVEEADISFTRTFINFEFLIKYENNKRDELLKGLQQFDNAFSIYREIFEIINKSIESIIIVEPKLNMYEFAFQKIRHNLYFKKTEISDTIHQDEKQLDNKKIEQLLIEFKEIRFQTYSFINSFKKDLQRILLGSVYKHNIPRPITGKATYTDSGSKKRIYISIDNYKESMQALFDMDK